MAIFSFMIIVGYVLVPSLAVSAANLTVSQSISDPKTLLSNSGVFELGFFSPDKSTKRYLGIWSKNIPTERLVWVANGANPINDTSGILTFSNTGNLELRQNDSVVWSTTYQNQAKNLVAELLDSGNFVVRNEGDADSGAFLWQSFDYPSDTLLPGMKLGWNIRTGLEWKITSWKSPDDPSPGDFSWGLMRHSYPEFYLMNGTLKSSRIGPWNGVHFSGVSNQNPNLVYQFNYVTNNVEMFYSYTIKDSSVIARVKIIKASFQTHVWVEDMLVWRLVEFTPRDECDLYGLCGAYGNCRIEDTPVCQCLKGFSPKSRPEWKAMNWSQGCVRNKALSCNDSHMHAFVKYSGLKVPDTAYTWLDEHIDLDECRIKCLNRCSCMAYTNSDIRGAGSNCYHNYCN